MHGAGNDYIYVDTQKYDVPDPSAAAIAWSNRHTGIGSDGLVLIGKPYGGVDADFSMRIFNADGSEAKMCGNASRCIGKYLYERRLTDKTTIRLQTLSSVKLLKRLKSSSRKETRCCGTPRCDLVRRCPHYRR
jgi:diaminopimelate epimerase